MVRLGPHRATKVAENAPDAAQALRAKLHRILFVVVAVVILAASAAGQGGPGWAFAIPWSLGVVVVSQAFLLRVAYELRLEGDVLAWKTPLRSGSVHLADIGRLRPAVWGRNAEQIELTSGKRDHRHRSIRIPVRRARPCGRRSRGACRSQSLRDAVGRTLARNGRVSGSGLSRTTYSSGASMPHLGSAGVGGRVAGKPGESTGGLSPPAALRTDVTVSRHPAPTGRPLVKATSCQWANSLGSRR
jgi:hypothetical protein